MSVSTPFMSGAQVIEPYLDLCSITWNVAFLTLFCKPTSNNCHATASGVCTFSDDLIKILFFHPDTYHSTAWKQSGVTERSPGSSGGLITRMRLVKALRMDTLFTMTVKW